MTAVTGLFDNTLDGWVDGEGDLWDVNVLLEVEKTHFQLVDLLLYRGHQFVTITVKLYKIDPSTMCSTHAFPRLYSTIHAYSDR